MEIIKKIFIWLFPWLAEAKPTAPPTSPKMPPTSVPIPEVAIKPPLPVKTKNMPNNQMLIAFATAQRDFEGKPGDRNYKNNNPGNYRFSPVGYLPKYGTVTKVAGFACFPTYELGWEYHLASILHTAHLHPDWNIRQYVDHYAPPSDDNSNNTQYAAALANACSVPVTTTLQTLFS